MFAVSNLGAQAKAARLEQGRSEAKRRHEEEQQRAAALREEEATAQQLPRFPRLVSVGILAPDASSASPAGGVPMSSPPTLLTRGESPSGLSQAELRRSEARWSLLLDFTSEYDRLNAAQAEAMRREIQREQAQQRLDAASVACTPFEVSVMHLDPTWRPLCLAQAQPGRASAKVLQRFSDIRVKVFQRQVLESAALQAAQRAEVEVGLARVCRGADDGRPSAATP